MIYIKPNSIGDHVFQVFDEPADDTGTYDPTVLAVITRAELVAAIEQIDLHTNAVMSDEIDEDPEGDE